MHWSFAVSCGGGRTLAEERKAGCVTSHPAIPFSPLPGFRRGGYSADLAPCETLAERAFVLLGGAYTSAALSRGAGRQTTPGEPPGWGNNLNSCCCHLLRVAPDTPGLHANACESPPIRAKRAYVAQASAGVFLLKSPREAGSTIECRLPRCSSAGQFRELEAPSCTLVQKYHSFSRAANPVRSGP